MNINVHKFGGTSLKDAPFIINVANIIQQQNKPMIVIVSAMGKMTNALEEIVKSVFYKKDNPTEHLQKIKNYHSEIIYQLFHLHHPYKAKEVETQIHPYWQNIEQYINQPVSSPYGQIYDQIVSIGEIVSSIIVSEYLNTIGIYNTWADIRKILITDNHWRAASVNIPLSQNNFSEYLLPLINDQSILLTQGFIASTAHHYSTTLGREGSDYTAALLAYFVDAKELTIWKDVDGVLNADPRYFKNTQKIDELTYYDAIEMTYYGATVIHPNTIKPIQNKNIPLKVKSFLNPSTQGTIIHHPKNYQKITTYSYLPHQILISLQSNDYSFFAETHLHKTFQIINDFSVKINLMQNTALNFSICTTNDEIIIHPFIRELQKHFKVLFNENVAILTIRHYTPTLLQAIVHDKEILLEQRTRHHVQLVLKEKK